MTDAIRPNDTEGPDRPDSISMQAKHEQFEKREWEVLDPQAVLEELRAEFTPKQQDEAQGKIDEAIQKFHIAMLKRRKSEIDTLLVYAALFSAILTAFIVESQKMLRPDSMESAAAALIRVSERLDALVVWPTLNRTEYLAALEARTDVSSAFHPTRLVIWTNSLWFVSLIISLAAASLALLVKQWLYHHDTGISTGTSRVSTELMQYRMDALKKWYVREFAMVVPALLLLALAIFLIGLVVFLWALHTTVAAVSSTFIGTLLLFLLVVTVLPAYRWDCCYRSPQALIVYTVVRPFLNRVTLALQEIIGFCSWKLLYVSTTSFRGRLLYALQLFCATSSKRLPCRTWEVQEQIDVYRQALELKVNTAVTAYKKSLAVSYLDDMLVTLSSEPGAPLLRCLRDLDALEPDAALITSYHTTLFRDDLCDALSRVALYALRQMLTIDRADREGCKWETTVQKLLNRYDNARTDATVRCEERTLRTAFLIAMEATTTENLYATLRILSDAMRTAADVPYSTVYHVLSATTRWIKEGPSRRHPVTRPAAKDKKAPNPASESVSVPQLNMTAFHIVVQCMLRVLTGKTHVPEPRVERLENLGRYAEEALGFLPRFLPDTVALARNEELCDQFSYGLQLLLAPLAELSHILDEAGTAGIIQDELVTALHSAWGTASSVLRLAQAPPARDTDEQPMRRVSVRTQTLEALRDEVSCLFPLPFNYVMGPLALPEAARPDAPPIYMTPGSLPVHPTPGSPPIPTPESPIPSPESPTPTPGSSPVPPVPPPSSR
ncbi:hypothetical protein BV20DRAFT_288374 [Pilatotrama ljubarskyi]|nr:hypothetical protein BV20DRAFT_288374 [Pilatotrama ljubarskyi]